MVYTQGARTTADSAVEGRLMKDVSGGRRKRKKRDMMRKMVRKARSY